MTKCRRIAIAGVLFFLALGAAMAAFTRHASPLAYVHSENLSVVFENEEKVLRRVQASLKKHDRRITLTFSGKGEYMEDISVLVSDLMKNALTMGDGPMDGDYIRYQYGGYTLFYSHEQVGVQYRYTIQIEPIYYTTLEQEQQVDEAVKSILAELDFKRSTSDYEKIRGVHDYLVRTVTYDTIHKKNESYHLDTTAYAAFLNGAATCQGYSVAVYRLLREAGVHCRIVTGTVANGETAERHAWNLVELDGVYYNLDATWDALLETEDYFLKSDHAIPDHVRDSEFKKEAFQARYPMAETNFEGIAGQSAADTLK
ncbi:transglutaminase domain-containing protein [Oscillibacter sp.]|uniref:transglutaminase domain-containing protein n=1 Tax=Oscillibacter sp. TaxID=1945593 RepID=UPI00289E6267|nr:transglutaminase domain-containing protein [Oscillibacter sp.]